MTVFERADRIGGLLRYGIPEFKMEKRVLDRRLALLEAEGVVFRAGVQRRRRRCRPPSCGATSTPSCLPAAPTAPRDLPVPGRELAGIHFAMDYLTLQNRRCEGDAIPDERFISAEGKHVVIIGGGDTGADCLGTVHRQGAQSVHQFELLPRPPDERAADNPWPEWPNIFRMSSAHEEGGERVYSVSTERFIGDDQRPGDGAARREGRDECARTAGRVFAPIAGTEFELKADLVLLAMGFVGPERDGLLAELGVRLTERGNVWRDENWMTSVPGVFTAGDMQRGQSLIVWAIAEGRSAAHGVDAYLMGDLGAAGARAERNIRVSSDPSCPRSPTRRWPRPAPAATSSIRARSTRSSKSARSCRARSACGRRSSACSKRSIGSTRSCAAR